MSQDHKYTNLIHPQPWQNNRSNANSYPKSATIYGIYSTVLAIPVMEIKNMMRGREVKFCTVMGTKTSGTKLHSSRSLQKKVSYFAISS